MLWWTSFDLFIDEHGGDKARASQGWGNELRSPKSVQGDIMWWIANDLLSHMLFQIQCCAITEQFSSVAHLPRMWQLGDDYVGFSIPQIPWARQTGPHWPYAFHRQWRKKDVWLSWRALTWSPYLNGKSLLTSTMKEVSFMRWLNNALRACQSCKPLLLCY